MRVCSYLTSPHQKAGRAELVSTSWIPGRLPPVLVSTAVAVGLWLGSTNPTAASPADVLVVGANFGFSSLDPARTIDSSSYMIEHAVYDSLVTFEGEDLTTIKPSLATEWKVSSDGRTYRFKLRPNVRFASGTSCVSTTRRMPASSNGLVHRLVSTAR